MSGSGARGQQTRRDERLQLREQDRRAAQDGDAAGTDEQHGVRDRHADRDERDQGREADEAGEQVRVQDARRFSRDAARASFRAS